MLLLQQICLTVVIENWSCIYVQWEIEDIPLGIIFLRNILTSLIMYKCNRLKQAKD